MHNATDGAVAVPSDDRNERFYLIVSDLVAFIDHVQTSLRLIDAVKAQNNAQADAQNDAQDNAGDHEFDNIVVLDDIAPLYAKARGALQGRNMRRGGVLQLMVEAKVAKPRAELGVCAD